jgi:hypothetical protein
LAERELERVDGLVRHEQSLDVPPLARFREAPGLRAAWGSGFAGATAS